MRCAHHPRCPGCPLLELEAAAQLTRKRDRIGRAFALFPHLPVPPAVRPSAWTEAYRHRLKLPVHVGPQGVAMGLYSRDGREVLDTPDCPVLAEPLRRAIPPLKAWLADRRGVHAVDLRVSAATGELALVLACADGDLPGGRRAANALRTAIPGLAGVAVSRADREGKRVLGAAPRVIAGSAWIAEEVGGVRYRLHPGAFFQVDPRQAAVLHGLVADAVGDARRVVDLYSGVGAYARMLAPGRERVVAVEELPQAARAAREGAPPNVEVIEGDATEFPLEGFDCAVLNPARRGATPALLARLARCVPRVVYVSCGPETLARDLDCLAALGLVARNVAPIDLFPQTAEVETVVTLTRGRPLPDHPVGGPWTGGPSGARGRPERVLALVLGDPGAAGPLPGGRFRRIGVVAGHALVRLDLTGPLVPALTTLARNGHPVAGREPRTARFFAEKAGLVRPFVHVELAGRTRAPLHGDLVLALEALGASPPLVARAGGPLSG
jgi:23S rRNA (uracil-5-)-methyltransferase RumA